MTARDAALLWAVDPQGLGGVVLRARYGPLRDAWLTYARALLPTGMPLRRVPLDIPDARLIGGLDLGATLTAGRPIAERGVLAEANGGVIVLGMAERLSTSTCARVVAALDRGEIGVERDGVSMRFAARFGVIALDEGADDDERAPVALADRLAFSIALVDFDVPAAGTVAQDIDRLIAARDRLHTVHIAAKSLEAITSLAFDLGIDSLRAPLLAARTARAAAALAGEAQVREEDIACALQVVLVPRANRWPAQPPQEDDSSREDEAAPAPEQNEHEPHEREDPAGQDPARQEQARRDPMRLEDRVLAATAAVLPPGLLDRLRSAGKTRRSSSATGRAGPLRAAVRGRPAGIRAAPPRDGRRLNVIETLRAAAPWQQLRASSPGLHDAERPRLALRGSDFRITRLIRKRQTTMIFAVDASGSTAAQRLSDAKGAVELLLAECYVRRDQAALISFRGKRAELLLPPTRSLARAKRCLAALPGGGGTPLAHGLDTAMITAESVTRRGDVPIIVLLTDGGANIARDGRAGRAAAEADALQAARAVRSSGTAVVLIDTAPRAQAAARTLATALGARYVALPRADAKRISQTASAMLRSVRDA